jgi:hypothetical protein
MRTLPRPAVQVPASDRELTFCPTPFVGPNLRVDLWEEGLVLFHCWAATQFKPGVVYGDFQMAEAMDVHRCLADPWIESLVSIGFAETELVKISPFVPDSDEVHAFRLKPPKQQLTVRVDFGAYTGFDPWDDRELDNEVPDARFADMFIDKYYRVTINEHFAIIRRARSRPNGLTFEPILIGDHPRYAAENAAKAHPFNKPPPREWRSLIDTLASG